MPTGHFWVNHGPGFFPPLLSWCVLVAAAALAGHWVHRFTGFPRMLGYTAAGLVAGWLSFGELPWPVQGSAALMLEVALGTSLLLAASQISLPWLLRQPWLVLQSLAESIAALVLTTAALLLLDCGWAVSLAVGVVAMAASPAVLLRIASDLNARGAVTDRSLLLATLSTTLALLAALMLMALLQPTADGGLQFVAAGLAPLLWHLLLSLLWAALLTGALWPVLRWRSSRSDTAALYLLAALMGCCAISARSLCCGPRRFRPRTPCSIC